MNPAATPTPVLIAHIVFSLGTGGLENGLVNLINRSDSSRFRHMVVCLTTAGRFAERIQVEDVPIIELKKPEGHSLKTFYRLRKVILEYRPAIIHSRNLAALESQIATLGIAGITRVHGEHGRDFNDPYGENWKFNALRRISRLWIDQYVAVSGELKLWLKEKIGIPDQKILQQPNGVDCEVFSSCGGVPDDLPSAFLEKNTLVIGAVGRLVPIKDHKTLITAFAMAKKQLDQQHKSIALLMVGDGPLMPALKEQVRELTELGDVWFSGDRSDVNRLLNCMDIFVLPSIAEGVSNTLLEAMASGLTVVSTSVGGAPDIIEDGVDGRLIGVGDPQELSEVLVQLAGELPEYNKMGSKAREKVEAQFSWPTTVTRYETMYQQLNGRSRSRSQREQIHAH